MAEAGKGIIPPETRAKEETRRLISSLESALSEGEVSDVQAMQGVSPLEGEVVYTSESDRQTKMTVHTEVEGEFRLYHLKTDTHDPEPFHMPDGVLKPGNTYTVDYIEQTSNGLRIHVGYQGRGYDFFYIDSLSGLEFNVTEKTAAELADEQLRKHQGGMFKYEDSQAKLEETAREVTAVEKLVSELPVFEPESPYRYDVDLFYAGQLYVVEERNLVPVKEFGLGSYDEPNLEVIHGDFLGNRIAIIGDTLVVIDDELQIAVGGRDLRGFSKCRTVDLSNHNTYVRNQNQYLLSLADIGS